MNKPYCISATSRPLGAKKKGDPEVTNWINKRQADGYQLHTITESVVPALNQRIVTVYMVLKIV